MNQIGTTLRMNWRVILMLSLWVTVPAHAAWTEVGDGPSERIKYSSAVGELWKRDEFAKLEQMGKSLRERQSAFPDGLPKLAAYYRGLGSSDLAGEAGFEDAEKRAQRWLEATPDSVTAPIVMAKLVGQPRPVFPG